MKGSHGAPPGTSLRAQVAPWAYPVGGGTLPNHLHLLSSALPSAIWTSLWWDFRLPCEKRPRGPSSTPAARKPTCGPCPVTITPPWDPTTFTVPELFFPVSMLVLEIWPPPFYACGISGFGNEDRATHTGFRNSFTFLSLHSLPPQLFSGSTTSHCQPVLRTRDIYRSKPESLRGF